MRVDGVAVGVEADDLLARAVEVDQRAGRGRDGVARRDQADGDGGRQCRDDREDRFLQ